MKINISVLLVIFSISMIGTALMARHGRHGGGFGRGGRHGFSRGGFSRGGFGHRGFGRGYGRGYGYGYAPAGLGIYGGGGYGSRYVIDDGLGYYGGYGDGVSIGVGGIGFGI